jgi:hypothetical protein
VKAKFLSACAFVPAAWLCLAACSGSTPSAQNAGAVAALRTLDHGRFVWVSAQCVDGVLDLARAGFERTLYIDVHDQQLRFTYDTRLAQPDCVSTEVWNLKTEAAGQWQFTPEAQVVLPEGRTCGAADDSIGHGVISASGDTLEELRFGSPWCRGFDVRFVYRRTPGQLLDRDALLRRYVAHWNRRDAQAVAALFADQGVLVEPLSRSTDGSPVHHIGRPAIASWLAAAFATTPWLGMELMRIEALEDPGQQLALWRYMDPRLSEPLLGRNLFVIADGEIFTTELQLLAEPVAKSEVAAHP